MNKRILEIIKEVHEKGYKYESVLMSCYSKEIFTRNDIMKLNAKANIYSLYNFNINSTLNTLVKKGFIKPIPADRNNVFLKRRYTVTKEGEKHLMNNFPGLRYEMSAILDHKISTKPPQHKFTATEQKIVNRCKEIQEMLLDKNKRYGNSSLEPFGLFTNIKRESKIEARIDDKLSRMKTFVKNNKRQSEDYKDAIRDLTGYLILYSIALEEE